MPNCHRCQIVLGPNWGYIFIFILNVCSLSRPMHILGFINCDIFALLLLCIFGGFHFYFSPNTWTKGYFFSFSQHDTKCDVIYLFLRMISSIISTFWPPATTGMSSSKNEWHRQKKMNVKKTNVIVKKMNLIVKKMNAIVKKTWSGSARLLLLLQGNPSSYSDLDLDLDQWSSLL